MFGRTAMLTEVCACDVAAARARLQIPEFADLGPLFRSSKPVQLTEAEVEYVVACTKHVFAEHVVLQFKVTNTVNDQLLSNVSVGFAMDPDDVWQVHSVVVLKELAYGKTGSCYVCLKHVGDGVYPVVQIANEVRLWWCRARDRSTGD